MNRRLFVLRVIIDTGLVAFLLWLLSLFKVAAPFPFGSGEAPIVTVTYESLWRCSSRASLWPSSSPSSSRSSWR